MIIFLLLRRRGLRYADGFVAFLKYYEKLAEEMGCTDLRIDTGGTNSRARRIYEKCGFKEVNVVEFSWGESQDAEEKHYVIFLEKYLGKA